MEANLDLTYKGDFMATIEEVKEQVSELQKEVKTHGNQLTELQTLVKPMPIQLKEIQDGITELKARQAAIQGFGEGVRKTIYLGLMALAAVGGFAGAAVAIFLK